MAAPYSERGVRIPQKGGIILPTQPHPEFKFAELRGRVRYYGNSVASVPAHSREGDGFEMEQAVLHALVREGRGMLVGTDLPNETYNSPRLKGTGGSDIWGFSIIPDGLYVWDHSFEVKSGKHLDVQETLGRQRSHIERTSQKPADLLYLLQHIYPRCLPFPKNVWISQPREMIVTFIGLDESPNEPMVDQKGRFPNVFYRQFDQSQGAFAQPKAA